MVAPQQEEVLGVLDLVTEQQYDGLQGVLPPVHIVAQEQVVGVRGVAPVLEYLDEVPELPMDVPHNLDGRRQLQQHGLLQEYRPARTHHALYLILRQFYLLVGLVSQQPLDQPVDVDGLLFVHSLPVFPKGPIIIL